MISSRDEELLKQGIWPPGGEELVIGEIDENGVITREYRVKPGEKIPPEALKLYAEALRHGQTVEIEREEGEPHSDDLVRRAIGTQRQ